MSIFRRKHHYTPPNPGLPTFTSPGGKEMWLALLDIRERLAALEARQTILMALLLLMVGAVVADKYL